MQLIDPFSLGRSMKNIKRKACLASFISIISCYQPSLIGSSSLLAGSVMNLTFSDNAKADRRSDFFFDRAYKNQMDGDFESALLNYSKAIEIDSNETIYFYNRALVKEGLKDFLGAISDYNKAIKINPKYGIAYFNRGTTKYELEDYKGAISDYSKSLEINYMDADSYLNRGGVYFKIGKKRNACKDFKKAAYLENEFAKKWLQSEEGNWCRKIQSDVKKVMLSN